MAEPTGAGKAGPRWFARMFIDLARQMRWSFLPPLMVYFAAGVSGLTSIVGAFFVKDYLGLSAAFLAGLAFWVGLPWVLKVPIGHLVDIFWRWKSLLVLVGAALIGAAMLLMYGLIVGSEMMRAAASVEAWYVAAALLAPAGYVVQDVVADAMTVEAVPTAHDDGTPLSEEEAKVLHTTMQTLGRFAIISGFVAVAGLNIAMFADVELLSQDERAAIYARIYLYALAIPLISVSGVVLAKAMKTARARRMRRAGASVAEIETALSAPRKETKADWRILGGGAAFVALSAAIGLSDFPAAQETVFAGTLAIIIYLMARLMRELPRERARALVGAAAIIFVFRAVPLPGPGLTWFEIDILGFDERFLSILSLLTSCLTLVGLIVLRPMMATRSIASIIVLLTLASAVLALPNIGLYYGLHEWTAARTGGVVDARFIAILDTAVESPLGQIAMIPMLAWIARNAPANLKATFFAVMASFTNLALSASAILTKHLNQVFVVTQAVRGAEPETVGNYAALGHLLLAVALIGLIAPLLMVVAVQRSRFRTQD